MFYEITDGRDSTKIVLITGESASELLELVGRLRTAGFTVEAQSKVTLGFAQLPCTLHLSSGNQADPELIDRLIHMLASESPEPEKCQNALRRRLAHSVDLQRSAGSDGELQRSGGSENGTQSTLETGHIPMTASM